jgi:O-succinylbenzoate synthase
MIIDRIELYHVAMPLKAPWRTAYGEDSTVESILCRMSCGSLSAWGESTPLAAPCYSPQFAGGSYLAARDWLAPALLGQNIQSGDQLQRALSLFKGNSFAKAVFDNAWWCLESLRTGMALHELLGAGRDQVEVGADFGVLDSLDELLDAVGDAVDTGFPRVKLKFRPGWDVNVLEAVRGQHPDHPLHIDCNSGYRISDLEYFRSLDRFRLAMFEQPLQHDDVVDHATLQADVETPICLDESIKSVLHADQAIRLRSCQFINVKPGRVGGLTNALAIHNLCADAGIPCWVGGMLESSVGVSHCIALAMLTNFVYPADIFPTERFYDEDLTGQPIELTLNESGIPSVRALTTLPEPNTAYLEALTVQSCDLRA